MNSDEVVETLNENEIEAYSGVMGSTGDNRFEKIHSFSSDLDAVLVS
jgi:hypothetical protein